MVRLCIIGDGTGCEVSFMDEYAGQKKNKNVAVSVSAMQPHFKHADVLIYCINLLNHEADIIETLRHVLRIKNTGHTKVLVAFVGVDSQNIQHTTISLPILGLCHRYNIKNKLCFLDQPDSINTVFYTARDMGAHRQEQKLSSSQLFSSKKNYDADVEDNDEDSALMLSELSLKP